MPTFTIRKRVSTASSRKTPPEAPTGTSTDVKEGEYEKTILKAAVIVPCLKQRTTKQIDKEGGIDDDNCTSLSLDGKEQTAATTTVALEKRQKKEKEALAPIQKQLQVLCVHNARRTSCLQCTHDYHQHEKSSSSSGVGVTSDKKLLKIGGSLCQHNRIHRRCTICCGTEICQHGRRRSACSSCKSFHICLHGKIKDHCCLCGGKRICRHGVRRSYCSLCKLCRIHQQQSKEGAGRGKPSTIRPLTSSTRQLGPHEVVKSNSRTLCIHGRRRYTCKPCNGSQICAHNRIKYSCRDCKGSQICQHNIQKSRCRLCDGSLICPHGIHRTKCLACGGKTRCDHGQIRSRCKMCGGTQLCLHGHRRAECRKCLRENGKEKTRHNSHKVQPPRSGRVAGQGDEEDVGKGVQQQQAITTQWDETGMTVRKGATTLLARQQSAMFPSCFRSSLVAVRRFFRICSWKIPWYLPTTNTRHIRDPCHLHPTNALRPMVAVDGMMAKRIRRLRSFGLQRGETLKMTSLALFGRWMLLA